MGGKITTIEVTMEVDVADAIRVVEAAMPADFWLEPRYERFGVAARGLAEFARVTLAGAGATTKDTEDTKGEDCPKCEAGRESHAIMLARVQQVERDLERHREAREQLEVVLQELNAPSGVIIVDFLRELGKKAAKVAKVADVEEKNAELMREFKRSQMSRDQAELEVARLGEKLRQAEREKELVRENLRGELEGVRQLLGDALEREKQITQRRGGAEAQRGEGEEVHHGGTDEHGPARTEGPREKFAVEALRLRLLVYGYRVEAGFLRGLGEAEFEELWKFSDVDARQCSSPVMIPDSLHQYLERAGTAAVEMPILPG